MGSWSIGELRRWPKDGRWIVEQEGRVADSRRERVRERRETRGRATVKLETYKEESQKDGEEWRMGEERHGR